MLIEARGIEKVYSTGKVSVTALENIDLQIEKGEFLAIMGPSGSGKSTFMNVLGCLDKPTAGSYILDGEDIADKSDNEMAEIRNKYIGFIFQSFNLLPKLTALENVMLPLIYRGTPTRERVARAKEALRAVGLEDRTSHLPSELSGGQQQRTSIARVLAGNPPLILADEPTGNLDSKSGAEVMAIFQRLNSQGHTIILVTHDEDIARHSQRIITFKDGQIVRDRRVDEPLAAGAGAEAEEREQAV